VHPLFQKADELSRQAIGAAIEVHRLKGPGLIESISLGLTINFHEMKLTDGLIRMILPGANRAANSLTEGNEGNKGSNNL
jgi:hypothetical protein